MPLKIINLKFNFGEHIIFENLNLEIKENTWTTMLGTGKTTLSKILGGGFPYKGEIEVNGLLLNRANIKQIRTDVVIVSNYNFTNKTLLDEIKNNLTSVNDVLKLPKVKSIIKKDVETLSASEYQIASIVAALVKKPRILILDNALCMLSQSEKSKIVTYLKKQDITIINMTNDIEETLYGDYVIIIKENLIVNDTTRKVINDEQLLRDNNLTMPFMSEVSLKLKYYGLVNKPILDMNRMVKHIWHLN
jgi:ABC-type cobalamin/Fe3+-siderophores transport system ATPase subunit